MNPEFKGVGGAFSYRPLQQTDPQLQGVPVTHPCQLHLPWDCIVRQAYAIGRWMGVMFLSPYLHSVLTAGVGKGLWSPSSPSFCPETSPSWGMGQNPGRITWARPPLSATLSLVVIHLVDTECWRSTAAEKYPVWCEAITKNNLKKKRKFQNYH